MALKFDMNTIKTMSLFEKITGVQPRDCLIADDELCFVVGEGKAGLAIGKNGRTAGRMEALFRKSVRVFEWSDDMEQFVRNIVPAARSVMTVDDEGKKVVSVTVNAADRAAAIGRSGRNINTAKQLLQRGYGIHDIRLERQRKR